MSMLKSQLCSIVVVELKHHWVNESAAMSIEGIDNDSSGMTMIDVGIDVGVSDVNHVDPIDTSTEVDSGQRWHQADWQTTTDAGSSTGWKKEDWWPITPNEVQGWGQGRQAWKKENKGWEKTWEKGQWEDVAQGSWQSWQGSWQSWQGSQCQEDKRPTATPAATPPEHGWGWLGRALELVTRSTKPSSAGSRRAKSSSSSRGRSPKRSGGRSRSRSRKFSPSNDEEDANKVEEVVDEATAKETDDVSNMLSAVTLDAPARRSSDGWWKDANGKWGYWLKCHGEWWVYKSWWVQRPDETWAMSAAWKRVTPKTEQQVN